MVSQQHHTVKVATPLGKDVLLFSSLQVSSSLGRLFHMNLELYSQERADIKGEELLGQPITVGYYPVEQYREPVFFNGIVNSFSMTDELNEQNDDDHEYTGYRVTLVPWLWFLTRTTDCRIFQDKTVPDIIKEVFRMNKFSDFDDQLKSKDYRKWNYCVQYRESDFNFVSRLMEQEGIYYYFKHEDGKHTMVLADDFASHEALPGYEKIPLRTKPSKNEEHNFIHSWEVTQQVQPGNFVLNDFNFTQPKAAMRANSLVKQSHDKSDGEIYDYPGEYETLKEGETYARLRIEEIHAQFEMGEASSNAIGLNTGCLFTMTDSPREKYNRENLIVSSHHSISVAHYRAGGGGDHFEIGFSAMDSKVPFRPERSTAKPEIAGPQTAIVVGPKGDEIHTDVYGRVKVQFHWDRYGKGDENSSCWIRVSQAWAGAHWGSMHIPRIGQEVIVEFLEGDPDRPIITGRVYNEDLKPVYDLPENKTQSGIKSRSTKNGTANNFNEIRFEDKIGEEHLFIQAERDSINNVKRHHLQMVGENKNVKVGADYAQEIKSEYWVKANRIVMTANTEIYLEVNGNFISITDQGISIEGTMVNINCSTGPSVKSPPPGYVKKS